MTDQAPGDEVREAINRVTDRLSEMDDDGCSDLICSIDTLNDELLAAVRPLIEQRDESITQLRTDLTNETKRANQWSTRHTELVERLTKAVIELNIASEDQARSTGEGLLVSSLVGEITKLRKQLAELEGR